MSLTTMYVAVLHKPEVLYVTGCVCSDHVTDVITILESCCSGIADLHGR